MDQKTCQEGGQETLNLKSTKTLHGIACQTPEKTSEPLPTKSKDGKIQLPDKITEGLCEEGGQKTLNLKSTKTLQGIACQTPEKTSEPLPIESKEGKIQLPDNYRIVEGLFDHMSCSLRLLNLHKKSPTFQNICAQVEVLAKRQFLYMHLAQMKYLLPEAIHIDKVLVHDKKTLCMKPDLKVTLDFGPVEGHSSESAYIALRKLFGSRLTDFLSKHPEATDVPEAMLPEPFGQKTSNLIHEDLPVESLPILPSTSNQIQLLLEKLHPYPSFSRHFSRKNMVANTEKEGQSLLSTQAALSSHASDCQNKEESECQKRCAALCSNDLINQGTEKGQQIKSHPEYLICPPHSITCSSFESPNVKIASPIDSLMMETPEQSTPRRRMPSSDVKFQIMTTQNSTSCQKPAKRVLDFSHMEGDNDAMGIKVDNLESSRPENANTSEASTGCTEDCKASCSVLLSQEADERSNQTEAGLTTWQQVSSSLLDLVDVIQSIFQSVKCSLITKEELLHKIIINSLDFTEIREVEEQIKYLEKVVPDWISKKLVPTGDVMYCVKKVSDLDSVRSRLFSSMSLGVK